MLLCYDEGGMGALWERGQFLCFARLPVEPEVLGGKAFVVHALPVDMQLGS